MLSHHSNHVLLDQASDRHSLENSQYINQVTPHSLSLTGADDMKATFGSVHLLMGGHDSQTPTNLGGQPRIARAMNVGLQPINHSMNEMYNNQVQRATPVGN